MTMSPRVETPVWDLPTRLFHWSLVVLVGTNLFLIGPRGGLDTVIHFVAGYVIFGLLVFRLAWGFIGSPRSRFADFVHRWPTVSAYLGRLLRFNPPHSVGHNPLGGWMIVFLIASIALTGFTGWIYTTDRYWGVKWVGELHEGLASTLLVLIALHLAGVALASWRHRENLVAAMLHGRKRAENDNA